jgi:hypothetical protein
MKVINRAPSKWYTQDGPISTKDLDHQQLSNIYWYFYLILDVKMAWIAKIVEKRFAGEFLVYTPTPAFKAEIKILKEKGLIKIPSIIVHDFGERGKPQKNKQPIHQFIGGE